MLRITKGNSFYDMKFDKKEVKLHHKAYRYEKSKSSYSDN